MRQGSTNDSDFSKTDDLALRFALLGPWAFSAEPLVVWQQSVDSLSREALSRTIFVKECELDLRRRLSSGTRQLQGRTRYARIMKKEVRRNQRELVVARLGRKQNFWARMLATTLGVIERAQHSLFRRSPGYPWMRVASLDRQDASIAVRRKPLF